MAEQTPHYNRRWAILGVISLAYLMIVLDVTVMNVALPNAQKALGFSNDQRQWIVTAYSLAFGSMLLVGGKISDIVGRKRTFIAGLAGFAIVSAIGGASQSFAMLAGARALQGLFGALLAPSALSLLTTTFTDPSERSRAFGIWGAIAGSGASVGLLLGGALTQLIDWRAVLFVNLVLAAFAIAGGLALLHNDVPERKPKLDWPGTVTVTAGLFALVYGLSHAETTSWSNSVTRVSLVLAAVLLAAFVWVERRVTEPLLPLRLLASRARGASLLSIALAAISLFGAFLFLTYYMQQNLGFSPILTGVAFLPLTILVVVTATLATTRLSHIAPRRLVSVGMLLGALAMLYLTQLGVGSSYGVHVLPALVMMGAALGLVFAPSMNYGTLGLREDDAGVGSAAVNTSQQVGGAVGTALLSTLAASATTGFTASAGVSKATAIAQATVHGYTTAFTWGAGIFLLGAIVAALLFPRGIAKGAATETAAAEPVAVH